MAGVAHFCLQKLHMLPSKFLELEEEEQAFVIASVEKRIEAERRAQEEMKRKGKR